MPRQAFTLLELLLVMAILAAIATLVLPQVGTLLGDRRIVRGANIVREQMMQARLQAMRNGRIYTIDAMLESGSLRVKPYFSLYDSVNAVDQTGTQSALLTGADQTQITAVMEDETATREIELPEDVTIAGVSVVSSVRSAEIEQATLSQQAGGYSQPILFYPDGTTSTAAVVLSDPVHGRITVKLRGITGDPSVGEVGPNP